MAEAKTVRFAQQFCDRSPDGKVALPRDMLVFLRINAGDKITVKFQKNGTIALKKTKLKLVKKAQAQG